MQAGREPATRGLFMSTETGPHSPAVAVINTTPEAVDLLNDVLEAFEIRDLLAGRDAAGQDEIDDGRCRALD
jgi:hypothetical protein